MFRVIRTDYHASRISIPHRLLIAEANSWTAARWRPAIPRGRHSCVRRYSHNGYATPYERSPY